MKRPLVSVIIPIYKVERFLPKCLDSVTKQTYPNLDIILVNDGSPDESGRICEEYAAKDKRITTIHKNNEGVVLARITGFRHCKGEYIIFIDADDYIAQEAIEILVRNALKYNVDLVVANHYVETVDRIELDKRPLRVGLFNKNEIRELLKSNFLYEKSLGKSGCSLYLWGKLYKKECLLGKLEKGIGHSFAEDIISFFATMQEIESLLIIEEPVYYYVSHEDQITKIKPEDLWQSYIEAWKKLNSLDKNEYLATQLPERIMSKIPGALISISTRKGYEYYKNFIKTKVHDEFINEKVWNNKQLILFGISTKLYYSLVKRRLYFISYLIGKYNIIDKAVSVYKYIHK